MNIKWNKKHLLLLCMGLFVILSLVNNLHILEGLDEGDTEEDPETLPDTTGDGNTTKLDPARYGFYPDTFTKVMSITRSYHKSIMDFLENDELNTIHNMNDNTMDEIEMKKQKYISWIYTLNKHVSNRNDYIMRTYEIFRLHLYECDDKKTFKLFLTDIDNMYGEDNTKIANAINDIFLKMKAMTIKNMENNLKSIRQDGIYKIGNDIQMKENQQKYFLKNINVLSESLLEVLSFTGKNTLNTDKCS